ncbi:MAG TPA: hypothetical protein DD422_11555, partial [Akkermansia sp.]|nr:hypothetical protein [Akkermansia sp.]
MAAGCSRIRGVFLFCSRICCFAAEEFFCRMAWKTGACGRLGSDSLFLRELESLPSEAFQHQGKFRLLRLRMFFQRRGGEQELNK